MSNEQILAVVRDELARLAPEIDFDSVDRTHSIQRAFDIDSTDFLNFITALHERLGVDVPESDYTRVATVDGALTYLSKHLEPKPGASPS